MSHSSAQNPASANPAVDLTQLRSFTDGNAEMEERLATIYLDNADAIITGLKAICNDEPWDGEDWSRLTHKLKGMSANLGANILSALCKNAQHEEDHEQRQLHLSHINDALVEIIAYLKAEKVTHRIDE